MRIHCEKCRNDITVYCDSLFEKNNVGSVQCPKCQKIQSRYISEADLLLYFGCSESFFIIISLLTMFILDNMGISLLAILLALGLFCFAFFVQKNISRSIYLKAYGKDTIRNQKFKEDKETIKKNLNWQFMLFYAITIMAITIPEMKSYFIIMMIVANLVTYFKFYFQLKYEKKKK